MVGASSRPPLPPSTPLEGLPEAVAAEALWWERHIVEVVRGVPPQAPAGRRPKPEYDPAAVSLTRREQAQAAELTVAGRPVTASAVAKRRRRYEARGLTGMADHRGGKPASLYGQVDPAVVEAMQQTIAEAERESSRTATYLFWRTSQILETAHRPSIVELPSQRSLYRLLDKLSAGKHTTGSARTRRSLADRPGGPFGEADAWAPGEVMQMDSTPLDVLVRLDDGVSGRVDLTGNDRCRDQDREGGRAAACHQVGGRQRAAGPRRHPRADAAGQQHQLSPVGQATNPGAATAFPAGRSPPKSHSRTAAHPPAGPDQSSKPSGSAACPTR